MSITSRDTEPTETGATKQETRTWVARLQALHESSLELNAHQSVPNLLDAILRRAVALLDVQAGVVMLLRPDGRSLEVVATTTSAASFMGAVFDIEQGLGGQVARTGAPAQVNDYRAWEGQAAQLAGLNVRRMLGTPLKIGRRVTGVLIIADTEKPGSFNEDDVRLASLFADQAAIALENAQLMEQARSELAERTRVEQALRYRMALENLVTQLSTHFSTLAPGAVDDAISQGLSAVGSFEGAERAYVVCISADGASMSNTHEWCATGVEPGRHALQDVPSERLPWLIDRVRRRENIHVPLVSALPPEASAEREIFERAGIQSLAAVPMVIGQNLVGFLGFDAVRRARTWTEDEISLLRIFGEIIANAIARKRAHEAQRRTEQIHRALFERTNDAVYIMDVGGRYLAANSAATEMLGYSLDELLTMTTADVVVLDEQEDAKGRLAVLQAGGQMPVYERTFRRKDGSLIRVEVDTALVRDADGTPLHIQGIVRDITERRSVEQELRISEQRLRLLTDNTRDVVWTMEPDGTISYVSSAVEALRGITPAEAMAQPIEAIHPPESAALSLSYFQKLFADVQAGVSPEPFHGELEYWRKDGSTLWCEVHAFPLLNSDGGFVQLLGVSRDLSERKAAEARLRELGERYRLLSEASADVIWMLDLASERFTYASPAIARLAGYTPDEFLAQPLAVVLPPDSYRFAQEVLAAHVTAFAGGDESARQIGVELEELRKDGSIVPIEVNCTLLADAEGRPVQLQGVSRDITQRKRAEAELAAANQAVIEARDQALEASKLKSEFLATMSHELRTPLNAIIGLSGLLLETHLDARQSDYAETVRRSSEILLTLINDILDLSKIEAGRLELEEQPFGLRECVETALDFVTPTAAAKGLSLTSHIAPDTPSYVVGDVTRLRQMLVNLLSNAVKFTEKGSVAVTVELRSANSELRSGVDDPAHSQSAIRNPQSVELHFAVTDTGIGMTPEQAARLFQPFTQADASISRRYGGTGLGLTITQRLAQMMGGRTWVESEAGRGSVFHFTVQLTAAPGPATSESAGEKWGADVVAREAAIPQDLGAAHPLRILLAEDSPVNQKVAQYLLERIGYRADVAANGQEVLEALARQPYDVVLMDVQMPDMDGVEAASLIRDRCLPAERPTIIAMTAHVLAGDRERFLAAGMDDYIAKPIRLGELANVLHRCAPLGARSGHEPSGPTVSVTGDGTASHAVAPGGPAPAAERLGPALDPDALADLAEALDCGPDQAIAAIGPVLLDYAPPLLASMQAALARMDGGEIARSAHALKSSCASAAALRLSGLCAEMERLCAGISNGDPEAWTGVAARLAEVEAEFVRVQAAIESAIAHPISSMS